MGDLRFLQTAEDYPSGWAPRRISCDKMANAMRKLDAIDAKRIPAESPKRQRELRSCG